MFTVEITYEGAHKPGCCWWVGAVVGFTVLQNRRVAMVVTNIRKDWEKRCGTRE